MEEGDAGLELRKKLSERRSRKSNFSAPILFAAFNVDDVRCDVH
jgi:hypothetical protein